LESEEEEDAGGDAKYADKNVLCAFVEQMLIW
jgi:hypothetical protein